MFPTNLTNNTGKSLRWHRRCHSGREWSPTAEHVLWYDISVVWLIRSCFPVPTCMDYTRMPDWGWWRHCVGRGGMWPHRHVLVLSGYCGKWLGGGAPGGRTLLHRVAMQGLCGTCFPMPTCMHYTGMCARYQWSRWRCVGRGLHGTFLGHCA